MSIPRGRLVATFDRPGDKFRWFDGKRRHWQVYIKERLGSMWNLVTIDRSFDGYFKTLEEAKAWAIARLKELSP